MVPLSYLGNNKFKIFNTGGVSTTYYTNANGSIDINKLADRNIEKICIPYKLIKDGVVKYVVFRWKEGLNDLSIELSETMSLSAVDNMYLVDIDMFKYDISYSGYINMMYIYNCIKAMGAQNVNEFYYDSGLDTLYINTIENTHIGKLDLTSFIYLKKLYCKNCLVDNIIIKNDNKDYTMKYMDLVFINASVNCISITGYRLNTLDIDNSYIGSINYGERIGNVCMDFRDKHTELNLRDIIKHISCDINVLSIIYNGSSVRLGDFPVKYVNMSVDKEIDIDLRDSVVEELQLYMGNTISKCEDFSKVELKVSIQGGNGIVYIKDDLYKLKLKGFKGILKPKYNGNIIKYLIIDSKVNIASSFSVLNVVLDGGKFDGRSIKTLLNKGINVYARDGITDLVKTFNGDVDSFINSLEDNTTLNKLKLIGKEGLVSVLSRDRVNDVLRLDKYLKTGDEVKEVLVVDGREYNDIIVYYINTFMKLFPNVDILLNEVVYKHLIENNKNHVTYKIGGSVYNIILVYCFDVKVLYIVRDNIPIFVSVVGTKDININNFIDNLFTTSYKSLLANLSCNDKIYKYGNVSIYNGIPLTSEQSKAINNVLCSLPSITIGRMKYIIDVYNYRLLQLNANFEGIKISEVYSLDSKVANDINYRISNDIDVKCFINRLKYALNGNLYYNKKYSVYRFDVLSNMLKQAMNNKQLLKEIVINEFIKAGLMVLVSDKVYSHSYEKDKNVKKSKYIDNCYFKQSNVSTITNYCYTCTVWLDGCIYEACTNIDKMIELIAKSGFIGGNHIPIQHNIVYSKNDIDKLFVVLSRKKLKNGVHMILISKTDGTIYLGVEEDTGKYSLILCVHNINHLDEVFKLGNEFISRYINYVVQGNIKGSILLDLYSVTRNIANKYDVNDVIDKLIFV